MSKRIGVVAALCVLMGGLVSTGAMATPPKPLQMGSLTGVYESSRGGAGYGTYDIDLATIPTDGSAPSTTQWYCWHDYAGRGEVACGVSQSTEQLHGYASTPRFLDLGPPDFCLLGPLCVGPQTTAGTFSLSVALDSGDFLNCSGVQTYKEVGPKADSAYDLNGGCVLVPKAQAGVNDGVGTFNGYFTKAQNGEVSFRSAVELGGFQHTGVFSPQPGRCDGTPADTYCWRTGAVDGGLQGLPSHVQLGRTGTVTDPTKARAKDGLGSWLFSIKKGKASMTCTGGAVVIVTPTTTSWTNAQGPCVASF